MGGEPSRHRAATPDVLVLGSNGFLGLHIVDGLRELGVEPRCGRRTRSNVLGLRSRKATMVPADLDQPETLRRAMDGCATVVHAAGHYPRTSQEPDATLALGLGQLEAVLDAAAATGVERLVYVSSTATVPSRADGTPSTEDDLYLEEPRFGTYHRLKWAMEQRVAAENRTSVRVVCPAGCLGPGDLRLGTAAMLLALARGDDPPHPDGMVSLVDVRDVGRAVARVAMLRTVSPRLLLSSTSMPLHELMVIFSYRFGVAPPSAALPADVAVALADAAEQRALATGSRPSMSREIVDLVVHGAPIDASLALRELSLRWTPLSQTIDDFENWARRMRFLPLPPELHP